MAATSWVDIRTAPPTGGPLGLITGYSDVWIEAKDLDWAARFYGELIGFGHPASLDEGVRFSLNPIQSLTIVQRPNPRSLPETGVHQAYRLQRREVEPTLKRLAESGVEVHRYHEDRKAELHDDRYCFDPDGNRVQLVAGSEPGIDHVAVETHDVEWTEVFYTQVLGARIEMRVGWKMDDFAHAWAWGKGEEDCAPGTRRWDKLYTDEKDLVPRPSAQVFFEFGPGVTYGVYLSNEHRQEPPPGQFQGTPRASFWVESGQLDEMERRLKEIRLRCMNPSERFGGPFERERRSLFVRDTGGNFLELRERPA